MQTILIKSLNC